MSFFLSKLMSLTKYNTFFSFTFTFTKQLTNHLTLTTYTSVLSFYLFLGHVSQSWVVQDLLGKGRRFCYHHETSLYLLQVVKR